MSGADKLAEKIPGWVERLLIPTLETRIRAIVNEEVKDEVGHLEKTMLAKFEAVDRRFEAMESKFDGKFEAIDLKLDAVNTRIDSLERQVTILQDVSDLKARLAIVEKRTAG